MGGSQPGLPQAAGGRADRIATGSVSTKNGRVTIDLARSEATLKKELDARGITVFDKVPAVKGLNSCCSSRPSWCEIQRLVRFLNKLAVVLPIVTLLLLRRRRRPDRGTAGGDWYGPPPVWPCRWR